MTCHATLSLNRKGIMLNVLRVRLGRKGLGLGENGNG
jgi:hypothetical protein